MMLLPLAESCRISGEPLKDARLLFAVESCPIPGIYPEDPDQAKELTSPLRVVQARQSGFVQLAHVFDGELYRQYAFAGGGAGAYRMHLNWFADRVAARFPKNASVLEVGCGDGWLLRKLKDTGYHDVLGIDPSRAASKESSDWLLSGYFPHDLPPQHQNRTWNLIVCRHVLEHIETPVPFMKALAHALDSADELWIEVPDLDSTIDREIWSNFYQLHCNYFSALTLDRLAADAGLHCVGGEIVNVFGGSLLRRYVKGKGASPPIPPAIEGITPRVAEYQGSMLRLVESLPEGAVGYGAAERTAVMMGLIPALTQRLAGLYDGNALLEGRFLAGTRLRIGGKSEFFQQRPSAIVLFAISNAAEILSEWKTSLDSSTIVAIAGDGFPVKPLKEFL